MCIRDSAYDPRIHNVRGYPGAQACAENIRRLTAGSELLKRPGKKVQDAYSLRSSPQVIGAAKDAFQWSRHMLEIELNHAADNPVFFPDEDLVLTGANFQGTPLAFALELVGMSVTTVSALSERRLNRLLNPHLSVGLPAFLTKGAGMFSGLMLSQYTAGALVCENRVLCHPAATGSIPAAADQEDFVSMSMTTACLLYTSPRTPRKKLEGAIHCGLRRSCQSISRRTLRLGGESRELVSRKGDLPFTIAVSAR